MSTNLRQGVPGATTGHIDFAFEVLGIFQRAAHIQARSVTGRVCDDQGKRFFVNLEYEIQRILDTLAHLRAGESVDKILNKILKKFEGLFDRHQSQDNSYSNLERLRVSNSRNSPRRCGLHRFLQARSAKPGRTNNSPDLFRDSFIIKLSRHNQSLAGLVIRVGLDGGGQNDHAVLWSDTDVADTTWDLRSPDNILRQANHLYDALSRHWQQTHHCPGPGVAQLRLSCSKSNESSYDMMFSACSGHSQSDWLETDAEVTMVKSKDRVKFADVGDVSVPTRSQNHTHIVRHDVHSQLEDIDICAIVTNSRRQGRRIRLKISQTGPRNYHLDADLSDKHLPPGHPIVSLRECIRSRSETSPVTNFWEGLNVREKCILAFVLANSALEFHNSSWMRYGQWTKDKIYFKPSGSLGVPYLRKPYLAVHFRDHNHLFSQSDTNAYPSIFDLGIVLFEVYANAFVEDNIPEGSTAFASWAVRATALDLLREIDNQRRQNGVYDDQTWSIHGLYHTAITACLSHDHLIESDPGCDPAETVRDILRFKVIKPLRSILMKGYKMSSDDLDEILFGGPQTELSSLAYRRHEPRPCLHLKLFDYTSGTMEVAKQQTSDRWISRLDKEVHPLLERQVVFSKKPRFERRSGRGVVRIAILDTGIDLNSAEIMSNRGNRIKGYGCWMDGEAGGERPISEAADADGHGTHAAGLILKIAPYAEIYIARVAGEQDGLPNSQGIAKAIEFATTTWQAKIITMSFGFTQLDRGIWTAIKFARGKDVLFFAAASNSGGNEDIAFPAKHSEVISIRATCGEGNFAGFNPNPDPVLNFGTLGEEVSSAWLSSEGDTARRTGTSIATPIAASLAAIVLEYVGARLDEDRWLNSANKNELWWNANTLSGMIIMLKILAGTARENTNCYYIAPWNLGADWVWDGIKSELAKGVS